MDLLDRVRDIGADASPPSEMQLNSARQTLLREIARGERVPARSRRRWIGGSALVGGLAAAAVVVGVVVNPAVAPVASAAEVLERAAETTLTTTVLSPGPGQYIRIQEIATSHLGWTGDIRDPNGGGWDSRSSATEAVVQESRSLFVPADREDDWVRDFDESFEILEISGPDTQLARSVLSSTRNGSGLAVEVYPGGMYTQTGVVAEGVAADEVLTFAVNGLSCYYDEMPREPAALVRWLESYEPEYLSACGPPSLTEPENFNLAPAELRAAMFRALALSDGAKVVRTEGDVTTIALSEGDESEWMITFDIDTSTGLMVGRGNLNDDRWSSRIIVSIVDALPASVRTTG